MLQRNNGDGTSTVKFWYWVIRAWVIPAIVFIFGLGVGWASWNNRICAVEKKISELQQCVGRIEEMNQRLAVLDERVSNMSVTINRIWERMNR